MAIENSKTNRHNKFEALRTKIREIDLQRKIDIFYENGPSPYFEGKSLFAATPKLIKVLEMDIRRL